MPEIDAGELWDAVGPSQYELLMKREQEIVTWSLKLEVIAKGVCNG